MRVTLALSSFLSLALAASPASAQYARGSVYLSLMGEPFIASAGQSPIGLWLARADADRNGSVSLAEVTLDAERFFKRLDVDGDGRIGGYEMTRYEEEIAPAALRAAAGARPVEGDREDSQTDGTGPDPSQAPPRKGRAGLPGGMTGPQLSMSGVGSGASGYGGLGAIPQPVAMTDVDLSGSVTPEEFARAAARRFTMLDANKNGQLDSGELSVRRR